MSRSISAVFFDVDDTLVDYGATARRSLDETMQAGAHFQLWQDVSEPHFARYARGEVEFEPMRIERTAAFLRALGRDAGPAAVLERARFDAMNHSYALFDDVLSCLSALRERTLRLGVITNNDGPHQRRKLAMVGLTESFDVVAISGEVGVGKPDPAIFAHACAAVGVDPGAALHVGDRLDADALGAQAAGLLGVWLDRVGVADGESRVPVVSSLAELDALLT